MSKALRNILLIAAGLLIVGGVLAGIGFATGGFKSVSVGFSGIHIDNGSLGNVAVDESYDELTSIDIEVDMLELSFEEGESFALKGSYDPNDFNLSIEESGGNLVVRSQSIGQGPFGWQLFNFNLDWLQNGHHKLTLVYPKGTDFDSVRVVCALGDLDVKGLSAETVDINLNFGSLRGDRIKADDLVVDLDAGSCRLDDLSVANSGSFIMDAGSLDIIGADMRDTTASLNLGDCKVTGLLRGSADLDMDMGSLHLDLENELDTMSYSLDADLGSTKINGREMGDSSTQNVNSPDCELSVKSSMGSVRVNTK